MAQLNKHGITVHGIQTIGSVWFDTDSLRRVGGPVRPQLIVLLIEQALEDPSTLSNLVEVQR